MFSLQTGKIDCFIFVFNCSTSFNEIMPTIYKRFTEKEARQWRQIYKVTIINC